MERSGGVQDIIVTAQKREQNLQDVPVAVTALGADTLQANRVRTVVDLTGLAPGLVSRQAAGSLGAPNFAMRGVFANPVVVQDRQIALYIDGVYLGANRGGVTEFADLERIEVLRGPQGTLFGRNATAGAINIITREPDGEYSLVQELTVGNYDQLRTRTTVNLPQVGPFSALVTYVHEERRGDVRNIGAGAVFDRTSPFTRIGRLQSPKWLGGKNFENMFAALKFEPSSDFRMVYKFDRSNGTFVPEARVTNILNPSSLTGKMLLDVIAAQPAGGAGYGPTVVYPFHQRPKETNNAWSVPGFQRSSGHNLTASWDMTDSMSLKTITAYRRSRVFGPASSFALEGLVLTPAAVAPFARFQAIGTLGAAAFNALTPDQQVAAIAPFAANLQPSIGSYFATLSANNYNRSHQFSQEVQLNYDSDFLTVTVGALYYKAYAKDGYPGMPSRFNFGPIPNLLPLGGITTSDVRTKSMAAYAQAEFHLTPQLDIVVGGRLTKDKKSGALVTGGTFVGDRYGTGSVTGTIARPFFFKKTKPTYSIGANYKPNDDLLFYAKHSTGFVSGGGVGVINFDAETVQSQEVGIKADLFDRRVRANLALYNAVYSHTQTAVAGVSVGQPALSTVIVDNGKLKTKGFEFELTAAPTDGLTLGGSLAYSDRRFPSPSLLVTRGRKFYPGNVPPWVASVNAQYETQPLFAEARLAFRIDGTWTDRYTGFSDANVDELYPGFSDYEFYQSRWLFNGRISLRNITIGPAEAEIGVWGRNLTDNKDALYLVQFGDISQNSSYQPARTFGIDFIGTFR